MFTVCIKNDKIINIIGKMRYRREGIMEKYRSSVWGILILHILIIIYVITNFKVTDATLIKGEKILFNENWKITREDGSSDIITLPYYEDTPAESTITIENTIPEECYGKTLKFISADKTVEVYIDEKLVYEFGVHDERKFGKTPGSVLNCVDIPRNVEKGEIKIVYYSPYANFSAEIDSMVVGEREFIILEMIKENFLELGCCMIILFSGIAFLIMSVAQKILVKTTDGLEYLSVYCYIAFVYYAIETKILNIFYGNQTLYSVLVFIILMLMPLFLLSYYSKGILKEHNKALKLFIKIGLINGLLQPALQIIGLCDFMDMAAISHLLMLVSIGVLLKNLYDLNREPSEQGHWIEFIGIAVIGLCGISDIVRSYMLKVEHLEKYSRYGTTLFCFIMLVAHIVRIVRRYSSILKENTRILEAEVETIEKKNEELMIAEERAIAANEAKTNFLARMSHEIRTPIGAVLGMNEMILKKSKEDEIKRYATDIDSAANALLGIINEILDLSKIEAGKMVLVEDEYDFVELMHKIVNMGEVRSKQKNLEFKFFVDENVHMRLYGDEGKIDQILINLISNAVKYTKEGEVVLRVSKVKQENHKEILRFEVEDTGIGIREEDIPKLFSEYVRMDEKKNKGIEGTGLGMSITIKLLELMDSCLKVESTYGQGSRFYFDVAQKIVSDREKVGNMEERFKKREIKKTESIEVLMDGARILVVDDNELNRKVFKVLLEESKITIDEASSGMECLDMVKKVKYDMIFLDHMMPEMDGLETLKLMKEDKDGPNADTFVVALTANALLGAKTFYLESGFDNYLSKPIEVSKLYEILKENISISENEEEVTESEILIEGFDLEEAKVYLPSDSIRDRTLLKLRDKILQNVQNLREYADYLLAEDEEKKKLYTIEVHAIKGIFRMACNKEVADFAERLEKASKEGNTEYIFENNEKFIELLLKSKKNLEKFYGSNDEEAMVETEKHLIEDEEELRERLKAIYDAVYSFDENIIGKEMRELEKVQFPREIDEKVRELIHLSKEMEIGKMMELADEFMEI